MKKKTLIATALALFMGVAVHAQFVYDYLKAADSYYKDGNYASAAEYYEKYLHGEKGKEAKEFNPYSPQNGSKKTETATASKEKALYQLAESYRQLNYPSKAEPLYREVIAANKNEFPLAQYHNASQLRALEKYAEAEQEFKNFLAVYTTNDEYRKNAERELKNLQFVQQQLKKKDLKYYTVKKSAAGLNAEGGSYAPSWLNANTLLFTSTRPLADAQTKEYTNRLYQAAYNNGVAGTISLAPLKQDKEWQQGVTAVTPDGNTMFLTRWKIKGKAKTSSIWISNRSGDSWSDPVKLDESINAPGANTQQPFVTADGNYLLFASDRSGGQGGFDLWYAPLQNGKPGAVMNMGTQINSSYDEQAPSYHTASQSLIFSSNGRTGMGGYDFFQSKGTLGNWSEPVNPGYPVNSVKDDIYLVSRGPAKNIFEDVMLSSDRDAACCLELFYLKKERPLKQVSGRIVSCDPSKPLNNATVTVTDPVSNKQVYTKRLSSDGNYAFTLEDYQSLKVSVEAQGYIAKSIQPGMPADMEAERFTYPDLCLMPEPPKKDVEFVINNVYYDFNKAELSSSSYPALDEVANMLNFYPQMEIEISAHTDSKGSEAYNQKLSEARAKSVVDYLMSKGIAAERLKAVGYGETRPVAENTIDGKDNPAGREQNRRTAFKVVKSE